MSKWIKQASLSYHSPHKFRHGHAVYAIKLAKDIGALKAISQNLMHSSLSITDGVYGILSESDTRQRIVKIGHDLNIEDNENLDVLFGLFKDFVQKIRDEDYHKKLINL